MNKITETKKEILLKCLFAMLLFIATYAVVWKSISAHYGDFNAHIQGAAALHTSNIIDYFLHQNSYFMWHFLVRAFGKLFFVPLEYSSAIVTGLLNVASYLIVERIFRHEGLPHSGFVSFISMIVGPMYIPWYNINIYYGQGSPNVWHNPTWIVSRPFAILCCYMVYKMLMQIDRNEKLKVKQYLVLSLLLFLSVLAKPAFLQGFIPGLGVFLLIKCIVTRFKHFKQYLFICLTFVPGVLLMSYQTFAFFGGGTAASANGIGFGWMEVASKSSPNPYISTMLAIFFPLVYIILNIKKVYKAPQFQLSFSYLVCSWLEQAALYEDGPRKWHGNFSWCCLISLFIFWAVSIFDFAKYYNEVNIEKKSELVKSKILIAILGLHIVIGIYYYYLLAFVPGVYY